MSSKGFQFQQFYVAHDRCAHKVGLDSVLLGAWVQFDKPERILDIGSGSGLLSLICAQRFPKARVEAWELDGEAHAQSVENVAASPFAQRIQLHSGDFLEIQVPPFDVIISNPPYFEGMHPSASQARDLARGTALLPLPALAEKSALLLKPNALFATILPKEAAQKFMHYMAEQSAALVRLCQVYGAPEAEDKRWLMEFKMGNAIQAPVEEKLVLRDEAGNFSEAFRLLTQELYLQK